MYALMCRWVISVYHSTCRYFLLGRLCVEVLHCNYRVCTKASLALRNIKYELWKFITCVRYIEYILKVIVWKFINMYECTYVLYIYNKQNIRTRYATIRYTISVFRIRASQFNNKKCKLNFNLNLPSTSLIKGTGTIFCPRPYLFWYFHWMNFFIRRKLQYIKI